MAGLEKSVRPRYSGNGKFAIRKTEKQQQAIERNNAYQNQISTREGILQYINEFKGKPTARPCGIGKKQMVKLTKLLTKND